MSASRQHVVPLPWENQASTRMRTSFGLWEVRACSGLLHYGGERFRERGPSKLAFTLRPLHGVLRGTGSRHVSINLPKQGSMS